MNKKLRKNSSIHISEARIAGLYDLEHTIGKGHFAVVKLARHVFTGESVAVKVIDKTRLDPISTAHMMQEVRCMKLVQHPNIVRLYEVIDTQTKLFLILELGDYDMYEWVMKRGYDKGGCHEADAQLYFSQIIKAINYCHKLHVVHRDLKPENVVFFEKLGMVKLTDFGFSNLFTPGEQLQTSCGSLAYSAPEILLGDAYDAPAVDVWSLGVILYMLVCGRLPFQESNDSETLTRILDCKFSFPDHVSADCRKLISSMLVRSPAKRATLTEIVQNKWVRAGDRGHAEALPLILRDHLPSSAHKTIVEQMVAGQIGSEEEILCAIERNDFSHLTATYYLLAERVLSCYRQAQAASLLMVAATAAKETTLGGENSSVELVSQLSGSSAPLSTISASGTRSRSRSNSWRGPAPRRAYSILKEESEEELSSYLRSSSRQSSRFFNVPSAVNKSRDIPSRASLIAISRANSNDSFVPGPSAIIEDEVETEEQFGAMEEEKSELEEESTGARKLSADFPPPSATSTPFVQRFLDPIREGEFRDQSPDTMADSSVFSFDESAIPRSAPRQVPGRAMQTHIAGQLPPLPASPEKLRSAKGYHQPSRPLRNAASLELFPAGGTIGGRENGTCALAFDQCSATSPPTPNPSVAMQWSAGLERHPNFANLNNLPSLVASSNLVKRPSSSSLSRRNSSPCSSMFRGTSSLHSSRDRISPQAIQELLELSRLSGRMRRTASPDSRLSSRSPSPSCLSSGRTSPAVSGIVSRLKGNFLPNSAGGMRKLSSSPHLLGICEETEEGDLSSAEFGQITVGDFAGRRDEYGSNGNGAIVTRSARSASMGLGTIGRISMTKKLSLQSRQYN